MRHASPTARRDTLARAEERDSLLEAPQAENESPSPATREVDWLMTFLVFVFPAVGGLLFGYDIGATSGALVSITSERTSGTDWYSLSPFLSGLVVSSSLFGALAGSVGAFIFGDKLGRRRELMLAACLYGASAILLYLAPNYPTLLTGRVMYGLGIGFAMHAAPAYIAETAPASVRGLLISCKEGFIVGGILLGYLASALWVGETGGWRYMYGAALPPALIVFAGMAWLPESPRWLLLSGATRDRAEGAVRRAWGASASDEQAVRQEVAKMLRDNPAPSAGGLGALFSKGNIRPLLVGSSLMLFQQITGQPSVLYYAAKIFKDAGFASDADATRVSVVLGFFKLVMTGVAVATVDKLGRRPLLLGGVTGLVLSLLALSGAQGLVKGDTATWVSVVGLLAYTASYQVSFGPISWLIVGEIFPLSVRGQAAAFATFTNFGSNFLVSLALPTLQDKAGLGATYLLFAGIGVVSLASIYLTIPETKGKTLEEIEALWAEEDKGI
ncbi:hypothetical protein ABBQ38_014764 [Trebouxia sp. C0009 RCD-2024]